MNIPKKIKIGGFNYDVIVDDLHKHRGHENEVAGKFCSGYNKIYIDTQTSEQTQHSSLLHETIHAIAYHAGLELSEEAVMTLESGLYQVIIDNPGIFKTSTDDKPKYRELK